MDSKLITGVVFVDGKVDFQKTVENFKQSLNDFIEANHNDSDTIKQKVLEFFTDKTKTITKSTIVDRVAVEMSGNDVAKLFKFKDKVNSWISDNTGETKDVGKLFKIKRGAKGGLSLWENES